MLRKLIWTIVGLTVTMTSKFSLASERVSYQSEKNKSEEQALAYANTHECSLRYLAYRDIPLFLSKYKQGKNALDYGSGTGFSIDFLKKQGFDVTGVDVSKEMISQAKLNSDTPIYLIENGILPFKDTSFDLIFSGLVLFEIGSKEQMLTYLQEAKRVIKEDGVMIALTASQDAYSKNWLDLKVDYPENKYLKSGDIAKSFVRDANIEFTDYYWVEEDYRCFFSEAGFRLVEIHYPLGRDEEPYNWKDEKTSSPYIILVAKKVPN